MNLTAAQIMIRPAYGDDQEAVRGLAALDSAEAVPTGPLLVAEVDGSLRVALSVRDGSYVADPFFPTLALVGLLLTHARAAQRSGPRVRGRRGLRLTAAPG